VGFLDAAVARFGRDTGVHANSTARSRTWTSWPACAGRSRGSSRRRSRTSASTAGPGTCWCASAAPSAWRLVVDDDGRGSSAGPHPRRADEAARAPHNRRGCAPSGES
jgi:hypothetical protein